MRRHSPSPGFTLVELSLAIAIVGLLLAGILGLGRLQAHGRLIATVADVQSVGAASAVFVDRYAGLPGDLLGAGAKIPGCNTSLQGCEADVSSPTTGDGRVGTIGGVASQQTAGATPAERETLLFWTHLQLTDLIVGVTDRTASSPTPTIAWGESHLAAPIGGGFHVKHADGGVTTSLPGWPPAAQQPSGTFLVLQAQVDRDLVPALPGAQVLTAAQASWIDRKIDDGDPFRGSVVGYGTVTLPLAGSGCFSWSAVDRGSFDEQDSGKDCGLAFQIAP